MDPSIRKLYQIFEQNKGFGSDESINPGQMKIQDLLYNVFAPGPSFYFIFDFTRFEFDFVSDPVSKILEVKPKISIFNPSLNGSTRRIGNISQNV